MQGRANAAVRLVGDAVHAGIPEGAKVVLAVSGGRDSMVLLDAMLRWRRSAIASVATYDHGTGKAAREASALVSKAAAAAGVAVDVGRGDGIAPTEAAWRGARWRFLHRVGEERGARIVTAHTRDDQIETVFMRALRGSGPRGLAGLYAPSPVLRPLLGVPRSTVAAYAREMAVAFADDPSNASRSYLRNRVRLDLLPALERAQPGFGSSLLMLARRAAAWRADVERMVDALQIRTDSRRVFVPAAALDAYSAEALAVVWPALAARAGIAIDRRGTARLSAFSARRQRGTRIQLAGGHEVVRHASAFEIRPADVPAGLR